MGADSSVPERCPCVIDSATRVWRGLFSVGPNASSVTGRRRLDASLVKDTSREMTTSSTWKKLNDAAVVVGDATPDEKRRCAVLQKGQLPVVDAGHGGKTQHLALQRNPFKREMLAHISLDQIGDRLTRMRSATTLSCFQRR